MKTLLIGDLAPGTQQYLEEKTDLMKVTNEKFLAGQYPDVQAVVLRTFTTLGREELARLPKLKYVVSCSVGVNNIDLEALREKNIELIHCPGTNANSVAEHTLHLMMALLRQDPQRPFAELKSKTVGIIGLGYIGKVVARKLLGFSCKVIAFDVLEIPQEVLDELHVEMKPFDTVVKEADILTVHVPLNKHTQHLINEKVFSAMKEGSFFVNTSRAEVIDEEGLMKHQEKFRGIALDVYSEGIKFTNTHVILTEHVAAQGEDSFKNQCKEPIQLFLEKVNAESSTASQSMSSF
jgi:lactate dehydrogenase-like 2-hydroxyacid dehydrogenase